MNIRTLAAWPTIAALKPDDARWIFVSVAILALLVIVGGLGVWYYRKKVLFPDDAQGGVWTFEDLRRLRESGELTEEEYQSLRTSLIGSFQGRPKQDDAPLDSADEDGDPREPAP